MILACKTCYEGAPETDLFIIDTSKVPQPLRERLETEEPIEMSCEERDVLEGANCEVQPPCHVDGLLEIYYE